MIDREYKVKYITSNNNFIFLPEKGFHASDQDLLVRLSYGISKTAYFSLGPPLSSLKEGELALSSVLAKQLNIFKNDLVSLSCTSRICSVDTLNIVPSSSDDYEILEILADRIQDTLLNQVRIVHNKQKIVIWVSHSIYVIVEVDGVLPISPGKLENLTKILIMQPNTHEKLKDAPKIEKRNSLPNFDNALSKYNKEHVICRLHKIEDIISENNNNMHYCQQPFNIFISKKYLPLRYQNSNTLSDILLVDIQNIPVPLDSIDDSGCAVKHLVVRIIVLENTSLIIPKTVSSTVFVQECIFKHFKCKDGAKIIIEPLKQLIKLVKEVKITVQKEIKSKADEVVKNYLYSNCQKDAFLMNSDVVLSDKSGNCFKLVFKDSSFTLIDRSFVRTTCFSIDDEELINNKETNDQQPDLALNLDCCNYKNIVDESTKFILGCLYSSEGGLNNLLITGKAGSGKTYIANHLCRVLLEKPHRTYSEVLSCKKLKGKNVESLLKILHNTFIRLIYYQQAVLVLDDLQIICPKVIDGDAVSQENLHCNKISEVLAESLSNLVKSDHIVVIATAVSVTNLNTSIFSPRGRHIFKRILEINELEKNDRISLLKTFFDAKEIKWEDIDLEAIAIKTDGFVVQDLVDYVDRVIFEAYKENIESETVKVTNSQCEEALRNSSSLAMRDVQLHSSGERDFSDIGGLDDVKRVLEKSVLWPARYSNIFGQSPLRLQSGLLLYGPPGTGKTILAAAAAKQCNMRLISVKGPELLSKYIGASEQAVRDIFEKAQCAKPCILFFDEFDSLAPRRGHDNTGVTDRVVNQFLTQLDGVESLNGVCVLAATSRPDLLDPALLRPGRLDRQILCSLPDRDSRLSIFKVLSKAMNLAKDVSLEKLADNSADYSGADIQAVLYSAQLNAVENIVSKPKKTAAKDGEYLITQKLLDEALRTTRPSLTLEEKKKYEFIYSKFQGKTDVLDLKSMKQKATLA